MTLEVYWLDLFDGSESNGYLEFMAQNGYEDVKKSTERASVAFQSVLAFEKSIRTYYFGSPNPHDFYAHRNFRCSHLVEN